MRRKHNARVRAIHDFALHRASLNFKDELASHSREDARDQVSLNDIASHFVPSHSFSRGARRVGVDVDCEEVAAVPKEEREVRDDYASAGT